MESVKTQKSTARGNSLFQMEKFTRVSFIGTYLMVQGSSHRAEAVRSKGFGRTEYSRL